MSNAAAPVAFPLARSILSGFGGAVIGAFPCAILYEVLSGADSFGGALAFLFGLPVGGLGGALVGVAISLHAHSARIESLNGHASASTARGLARVLVGIALIVVVAPILLIVNGRSP